jgi:hypothetical protein
MRALMRQLIHCLFRVRHPGTQYEIVILDDFSQDPRLRASFRRWTRSYPRIRIAQRKLERDFSAQKNALTDLCRGDFVVNLDADEFVSAEWIAGVAARLKATPHFNAYGVPRINVLHGLTDEDVERYRLRISEVAGQKAVDWPDTVWRIYRRMPQLRWTRQVHEMLTLVNVPTDTLALLPAEAAWAIRHEKGIEQFRKAQAIYAEMIEAFGVRMRERLRWGTDP